MRRFYIIPAVLMCAMLSGCTSVIDLTTEEEDLVAEYAAQVVVDKYLESEGLLPVVKTTAEVETESEPVTEVPTETKKSEKTNNTIPENKATEAPKETEGETEDSTAGEGEKTDSKEPASEESLSGEASTAQLVDALKISGVELSVLGYSVEDFYPREEYTFTVDPGKGNKLLVIEYDVWNSVDADSVMKVDASNVAIKAIINGEKTISAYKTMLKTDILNMDGTTFVPGEAKVGVLIFVIDEELAKNITSVGVHVS